MNDECYTQGGTKYPPECPVSINYRMYEQNKFVEEYIEKEFGEEGLKFDDNEKYFRWIESGLAKKFAQVFDENLTHKELEKLMGVA